MKSTLQMFLIASMAMGFGFACDDDEPAATPDDMNVGEGGEGGGGAGGAGAAGGEGGGEGGQGGAVGGEGGGEGGQGGVGGEGGGEGGQGGVGGEGGEGGMGGEGGLAPDMDVMPDAMMADMGPSPEIDAGPACMEGEMCGENQRCIDDVCRMDLRPTVYRMVDATVTEPMVASAELQLALLLAVNTGSMNLLFEAGGYSEDDDYNFYVGNGLPAGGTYSFRHNLPIQNFEGRWRSQDDRAEWHIEGRQPFLLDVPAGTVEDEEGVARTCWTRFTTNVNMQIWPGQSDDGVDQLHGFVEGYLLRSDIEQVELRVNGQIIRFIDFFDGSEPTIDVNGDGEFDAYPFVLSMVAEPIDFVDPDDTRDPMPPPPPACE